MAEFRFSLECLQAVNYMKNTFISGKLPRLKLYSSSHAQLLTEFHDSLIGTSEVQMVVTPNAEQLVQASHNRTFAKVLGSADLALAESGPALAFQFLSLLEETFVPVTKFAGIDVVSELLQMGKSLKLPMMLLGGQGYASDPGEITVFLEEAGQDVAKEIQIHWTPGYEDITQPKKSEETAVQKLITTHKPAIVFVAFGAPWQERWIAEHRAFLTKQNVRIAMVVGGSFDVLLGKLHRAPRWMRSMHLEWLYRLIQEPWRWRRQLRLLEFGWLVLKAAVENVFPQRPKK